MRNCLNCKFITDYGNFLFCAVKHKIIRHEIRDAILCRFYPLTYNDLEALDEFLGNYPRMEVISGVDLFNRYGKKDDGVGIPDKYGY